MADRYWVGGSGTWNTTSTTNWAASSGGASGASAPTAADNVFFDSNSNVGTGAFTVTVSAAVCNDFTVGSPTALDGAMTLAMASSTLTVSGSWTNQATNFSVTNALNAGSLRFNATTTGKTITTNGVTIGVDTTLNGVGGAWTLGSALNLSALSLTLTNGTFDTSTSNYAVTAGLFSSSNSNTRTINLNGSTVTLSGSVGWDMTTSTNATFNAGTSSIVLSNTASVLNGGLTFYNVTFSSSSSATAVKSIGLNNTFNNLTIAAPSVTGSTFFSLGGNQTVNGTLSITGSSIVQRVLLRAIDVTDFTTRTITCASATLSNVDFKQIAFAGAASPVSGTNLGDGGGNSNITFPAAKTVYWSLAAGGNWSATAWATSSGGTPALANFPLPQDTAIIQNTGLNTSTTVTVESYWLIGNFDASGRTNAMTLSLSVNTRFVGDINFGSGVSTAGTGQLIPNGTGAKTLTAGSTTITNQIFINSQGAGLTLGSNITCSNACGLTIGSLSLSSYTFTCTTFASSNSNLRTIAFGTGNISCSGTGTVWNALSVTNLTVTGTPVVNVTSAGSTAITVSQGALSEASSISFNFTGGTYALTFPNTAGSAKNINFTGYAGTWGMSTSSPTVYGNLTISTGMTVSAATGTMTFGATSGTQQITTNGKTLDFPITFNGIGGTFRLQDAMTVGSTRTTILTRGTLDLNNLTFTTGLFDSSFNSNTRTIAFGTGNISCSGTGVNFNLQSATNITITGTPIVNITSSGSTAITVRPGLLSESNAISFNFTGGTYALSFLDASFSIRNVNFTGYAGTWQATSTATIYGNLTVSTGMSLSASNSAMTFGATSGTQLITSNGKTLNFPVTFNGVGGTFRLEDAMTLGSTRTMTLTNGTLNLNGKTCTVGTRFTTTTGTKNLTFNGGTLVCPDPNTTSFNNAAPTNFTTTAGTGTGTISMTAATAKTFVGGGSTYNCTLNQGGAGTLTITGANTFDDIANTNATASQITFPASTTNTFNNFTLSGTSGNLISLRSSTGGTRFTLSKSSGTVNVSFLNIQDSNATGGATWRALATNGNVDSGNNLGWLFVAGNYVDASADVTSDATVTGSALRVRLFAGDVSSAAAISAIAFRARLFAGDISANASVEGQAVRVRVASGDITGNAIVTGIGNITAGGAANVSGFAEVSAYGSATYSFNALVTANADLIAKGEIIGEEWGDSAITSSSWTDATPASSTWQPASQSSNTWLRQ